MSWTQEHIQIALLDASTPTVNPKSHEISCPLSNLEESNWFCAQFSKTYRATKQPKENK